MKKWFVSIGLALSLAGCDPSETVDDFDVASGETEFTPVQDPLPVNKTVTQLVTYCQEVQWAHYHRSNCYQTYNNDTWLGNALQSCNSWFNVTPACLEPARRFHYWLTRRYELIRTQPPYGTYWFGDRDRWYCLGGWPVLGKPNDTDSIWNDYLACEAVN